MQKGEIHSQRPQGLLYSSEESGMEFKAERMKYTLKSRQDTGQNHETNIAIDYSKT
jgi:hypothetical protein